MGSDDMYAVEVKNICKSYGDRPIVDRVSFSVSGREILGLIGPNGAGKTTCIRMIMDVIKPDSGEVMVLGQKFSDRLKNQIGYLPEERGLYRRTRILDTIVYLATLKGMEAGQARLKAETWLTRVNMAAHKNKKIEELSHGMAQLIQFVVTVIHDPQIIILDEPFNGLDPVNVQMVKDIILDLKNQGKAIMLSTHRMNEVEALCDRVFMINHGQNVLYGGISEIKMKYRNNSVLVEFENPVEKLDGWETRRVNSNTLEVALAAAMAPQQLLERLVSLHMNISRFEVGAPSLNDIFIKVAGGKNE
jgi:ABC-2 type transport system ATP-binding protein